MRIQSAEDRIEGPDLSWVVRDPEVEMAEQGASTDNLDPF